MSISHPAASELKQLLGSVTAGGLIPELLRQGLKPLIEAEAATAPGAYRPISARISGVDTATAAVIGS